MIDQIKLEFSATECNGWPQLQICLNDDIYEEIQIDNTSNTVVLDLDINPGKHTLEIVRHGKNQSNTRTDDNNKIIEDQLVTLEKIYVNNVCLPDYFKYTGYFVDRQNIKHKSSTTWGFNGSYFWHFEMPIVNWAVFSFNNHQEQGTDLFIPTTSNLPALLEKLDYFEKRLYD